MRHTMKVQAGGDRLNDCAGELGERGLVKVQGLVGEGSVIRPFERREEEFLEERSTGMAI